MCKGLGLHVYGVMSPCVGIESLYVGECASMYRGLGLYT